MKPTCLDYALDKLYSEGGYLVAGRSIYWPIAHVLHSHDVPKSVMQYTPPDKLKEPWHSVFGFDGVVITGDDDPRLPMSRRAIVASFAIALALSIRWAAWSWWRSRNAIHS